MKQMLQRISAIGLLLLLLAAAGAVVLQPSVESMLQERAKLDQNLLRMARQSIIEARAADYGAVLQRIPEQLVDSKVYRASNISSAETAFQKDLSTLIQQSGAVLNATNGLSARPAEGFTEIALRLDATLNTDQLSRFLSALKFNSKVMVIDKASIRIKRAEDNSGPAQLGLNAEIHAFAKQ